MKKVRQFIKDRGKTPYFMGNISMSLMFTVSVTCIVMVTSIISLLVYIRIYRGAMEQNAMMNSEQAVERVQSTVVSYIDDMSAIMGKIRENIAKDENSLGDYLQKLLEVHSDVVAVTTYSQDGRLLKSWSHGYEVKKRFIENLSYIKEAPAPGDGENVFHISKPHVESLLVNYYPWVVTITQYMKDFSGETIRVAMDIRFSSIAEYVDGAGIGEHGYCYIVDDESEIVYHPQQQLIYAHLKTEDVVGSREGTYETDKGFCAVQSLPNCNWKIVGISYADEMITARMERATQILLGIFCIVILFAFLLSSLLSRIFSKPAQQLADAMGEFEENTGDFQHEQIRGTSEIRSLTESFDHMVKRIQELVEQVRLEEISLRKTELRALQAQINPHFLYNTLDAIAWLCEESRNEDAVEMVNALARLFRISISKGHELIPIRKEMEHAESYLKIQKYRYKNQFTYHFDVEEECLSYYCNKITLQPIIENALYHGLEMMVDEGHIEIGIHQKGEAIVFTVQDNGVGMTEEQCREILEKEAGDRIGIGIKNVNDRIQIYFGSNYGLTIESELDEGTCVSISMPKVTEDSYEEQK